MAPRQPNPRECNNIDGVSLPMRTLDKTWTRNMELCAKICGPSTLITLVVVLNRGRGGVKPSDSQWQTLSWMIMRLLGCSGGVGNVLGASRRKRCLVACCRLSIGLSPLGGRLEGGGR